MKKIFLRKEFLRKETKGKAVRRLWPFWKTGVGIALSICLVGTAVGCNGIGGPGGPEGMMPEQGESSVLTVEIEQPAYDNISLTSEVIGTVEPEHTAEVYPKGNGTVTAVYFEVGDTVTEGQTLAILDSDSLTSAQISINSAQLQLETAQKDLERTQILYENDGVTKQTLENAENTVASAKLQLESAQDTYHTLVKNTSVTAPISGVIESKDVEVYDNASSQKAICVISQKDTMQVKFQVPERVKNVLRIGTTVTLEKNGTQYTATVMEIPTKTVDDTGLFEITARIQKGTSLSTGSKVTVRLVTDKADKALCVSIDAIYYDNGNPYVYVNNNGVAEIVYIKTGLYDDTHMQIVSGLDVSSKVITSWSSQLAEGAQVQSVEEAAAEAEQMENEQRNTAVAVSQGKNTAMPKEGERK